MASLLSFPSIVNETAARIVAAGAVTMSVAYVATGNVWILLPLTYGFVARVLAGPRFSPLGLLATKVLVPKMNIKHKLCPGPPKRFAQGIGAAFTISASILVSLDLGAASRVVIAMLAGAASLEAFAGVCIGCKMFYAMMRIGILPESVCEECNDISRRIQTV